MTQSNKTTPLSSPRACSACGHTLSEDQLRCPNCTTALDALDLNMDTLRLDRLPTAVAKEQSPRTFFSPEAALLFQFLPSGTCLPCQLDEPGVVGRHSDQQPDGPFPLIDLSDHNALHHGISRRHCLLQRKLARLTVTDLGSANGTYLNGQRLTPLTETTLADGDKLILGTLHLIVSFVSSS